MRVLLTGATGFIGSNLLMHLLKKSIHVLSVKNKGKTHWRNNKGNKNVINVDRNGNFEDMDISIIKDNAIDTLIHLAWYGVENKYRNDPNQITQNLAQSINLFNAAKNAGLKTIIGVGSQAEYGPHNEPLNEETIPEPTTVYGVAKLCSYHILNLLCKQNNIRFVWLRLFSGYGPMDNSSWLIPMIILKLLNREAPDLTKGEQKWDYLYVDDICNAIIAAAENCDVAGVYNIGSGRVITIRSIAEKIRNLIDPSLNLNFGKIAYGTDQIMFLQSISERFQSVTGWTPTVEIEEGLEKTINWFKNNEKLFNN